VKSTFERTVLVAALALGAALRLFHLGVESVWFDEAYSIQLARGSIGRILLERWTDIHPPLYYLALHFWMPVAGSAESSVRLLSVLCDLMMIPVAWLGARRLFGREVALVTVVLLAVSPFHVQYSQEARMYALLCLLATVSMVSFLNFFETPSRAWRATYVVSTTLMLYTHIYSVFVIAAQVTSLGLVWRRDPGAFARLVRPWLAAGAVIAVLFAPWTISLLDQVSRVQGAFWIARPLLIAVFHPLLTYSGSVPLALLLVPIALFGGYRLLATGGGQGVFARPLAVSGEPLPVASSLIVFPWFLMSTALPFVLSYAGSPIFLPKYTIVASVPFAMLTALGITGLPRMRWRTAAAVAMTVLSIWRFHTYFTVPKKDGWRRAAGTLETLAKSEDVVLFYPWFNQIPFDYYHRRGDVTRLPLVPDLETPLPEADAIPGLVQQAVGTRDRVWLVLQQGISRRSLIVAELGRLMTPVQHLAAEHVELFLFEKRR